MNLFYGRSDPGATMKSSMETNAKVSHTGYRLTPIAGAERDQLARKLNDEERHVLLDHGTEPSR